MLAQQRSALREPEESGGGEHVWCGRMLGLVLGSLSICCYLHRRKVIGVENKFPPIEFNPDYKRDSHI
jgi:hypothetical protein